MEKDIINEVKQGRLPFYQDGDRIAKYGKGYSNLLHLAGTPNEYTGKAVTSATNRSRKRRKVPRHKESVQEPNSAHMMSV